MSSMTSSSDSRQSGRANPNVSVNFVQSSSARGGRRARAAQVAPLTTRESPAKARRPANALLDCTKFTETFGFALPDWRESLDLVMEEMEVRT